MQSERGSHSANQRVTRTWESSKLDVHSRFVAVQSVRGCSRAEVQGAHKDLPLGEPDDRLNGENSSSVHREGGMPCMFVVFCVWVSEKVE